MSGHIDPFEVAVQVARLDNREAWAVIQDFLGKMGVTDGWGDLTQEIWRERLILQGKARRKPP